MSTDPTEIDELVAKLQSARVSLPSYRRALVDMLDAAYAPPKDIAMHEVRSYIDWRPPALYAYDAPTRTASLAGAESIIFPQTAVRGPDHARVILSLRNGVFIPFDDFLATYYTAKWGEDSVNSVTKMSSARSKLYVMCSNEPLGHECRSRHSNDIMCNTVLDAFRTSHRINTAIFGLVRPHIIESCAHIVAEYIAVCDLTKTLRITNTGRSRGKIYSNIAASASGTDISILVIAGMMYGSWTHPEEYEAVLHVEPTCDSRRRLIGWYYSLPKKDRALLRVDSDLTLVDERA